MKPIPPHRRALSAGFTLVEIMITITIIAALAALAVTYLREANRKANAQDTHARIKVISDALSGYYSDKGEYPTPKNDAVTADFSGTSYKIGGAVTLYQALTGDGNDQIDGYRPVGGETSGASTGEEGSAMKKSYLGSMNVGSKSWYKKDGDRYFIVDAFKLPFQYRVPDESNKDEMHNATTFDLWSYGYAKNAEENEETRKQWITNWSK